MRRTLEKQVLALVHAIANASGRTIDSVYASFVHKLGLTQPFFKAGWGNLQVVNFAEDADLLRRWPPERFEVQIHWSKIKEGSRKGVPYSLLEGAFRTPCIGRLYDALPAESRTTLVQLLIPKNAQACVIHLAGTGDHGFDRRLRLGAPLLEQGIASLVLESPFYGRRRPSWQEGSRLQRVSDLLVLGRATIEESLCLLEWLQKEERFDKLGMSGFSMGGVHASMVASLFPRPVACTPLLAPRSASIAFCEGVLWDATAWQPLASIQDDCQQVCSPFRESLPASAARLLAPRRVAQGILETIQKAAEANAITAAARVLSSLSELSASSATSGRTASSDMSSEERHTDAFKESIHQNLATKENSHDAQRTEPAALADPEMKAAAAKRDVARTLYSSAASFLGFRTKGSTVTGERESSLGIDEAEEQLSDLWKAKTSISKQEARKRLQQVLETYTDVTRFPRPRQTQAAVMVGAVEDAYVTQESIRELAAHWPGCEVRWVPGGHVSAFLLQQPAFRAAIADSLSRLTLEQELAPPLAQGSPLAQSSDS